MMGHLDEGEFTCASGRVPPLPQLSAIPRDSAVATFELMRDVLEQVRRYAAGPRPSETAAQECRRRLAPIVDTVRRRGLSKVAVLDGDHALRLAEWVQAQTIQAWPAPRTAADSYRFLRQLRSVELVHLEKAIEQARTGWDVSPAAVSAGLAGVVPAPPVPAAPVPEPAVTMASVLEAAGDRLRAVAQEIEGQGIESPNDLDPEFAADLARTLWDTCTPAVALHNALKMRGKQ